MNDMLTKGVFVMLCRYVQNVFTSLYGYSEQRDGVVEIIVRPLTGEYVEIDGGGYYKIEQIRHTKEGDGIVLTLEDVGDPGR